MLPTLLQMVFLIVSGVVWKYLAPAALSQYAHRRAISDLVFYLLLPALILDIIWRTPLTSTSLHISLLASCGIITGLLLMLLVLSLANVNKPQVGALLLAAAFPNTTYLGLPVLASVLGHHTQAIALQYDLFACTPILLSFGILLAHHFGDNNIRVSPLREWLKIPPLWAVSLGVILNLTGIEQPRFLHNSLSALAAAVMPLMLIVLGMSLRWESLTLRFIPLLSALVVISLLLVPLTVFGLSHWIGLTASYITPVTLLAAMPTMIFGIIICERYRLDSDLYAVAVTLTTITSLFTLPIAFYWLSAS